MQGSLHTPFKQEINFILRGISPNGTVSAHAGKEEYEMGKPCMFRIFNLNIIRRR